MRFNIADYDKVFPRAEKPKKKKLEDESMLSEIEEKPAEEIEEELDDGMGTDGEPDPE